MPAGISALAPSTAMGSFNQDEKDSPAFTILQKDGLQSTLPLLHVNEAEHMSSSDLTDTRNLKNELYTRRRISKSNDHLVLASLQSSQSNPLKKKAQSKSQDNLLTARAQSGKSSMILSTEDFNEVLNAKLRKIQERGETEEENRRACSRRCQDLSQRKPFITTVKSGEFLMPPPEVAALLGIAPVATAAAADDETDGCALRPKFKPLMSLARRPEVRHSSHNARCQAALKATIDFSLGMMNATSIASSAALDERARRIRTFDSTGFPRTPRALPKKLEPIEGTVNMLPKIGGDQPLPFGNIMFDRRVVRGSTFATAPTLVDGDQSIAARQAEARKRHIAKKRAQSQAFKAQVMRIGSPPPVAGRKHEPVQTEHFLEELFEKPDESETGTQTDYFYDKPSMPKFCPIKTGQDVCTQIEPGELFDYDAEVQPILEVLVGKTIEQALAEVLEEEELAALKEQQRRFLELRAAELAERQRLEDEDRRIKEEKDLRLKEEEEAAKAQRESDERVAAAVLLTGYIAELLPAVLEGLKMSGVLLDEIKGDIEEGFMPWLMKEVKKEMGNMIESRELLMEIIREILENRAETYRKLGEEYDASREERTSTEISVEGGLKDYNFENYEAPFIENHEAA